MAQPQQDDSDPERGAPMTIGRIGRLILFFVSFGYIFPKAAIEGMNLTKIQARTEGNLYKK
jgi:hypothetical protein